MENAYAVVLGSAIAAGISFVSTWLNNRFAERKHRRELCFHAGIEVWKQHIELAKADKGTSKIHPPEDFILNMLLFSDVVIPDKKIDPNQTRAKMAEASKVAGELWKARRDLEQARKGQG